MGLKEDQKVKFGSPFPTVKELFSQLRSSFFANEFQRLEELLAEREEHAKEKQIELKNKVESLENEKDSLVLENRKLKDELKKKKKEFDSLRKENLECTDRIRVLESRVSKNPELEDELKKKEKEIDEMKKMKVEYERREAEFRVFTMQYKILGDKFLGSEKTAEEFLGSDETPLMDLENKQQKNGDSEKSKPPLFGEKRDSKKSSEPKVQKIIQIDDDDDDDDDDQRIISTLKRKRGLIEIKKENKKDKVDLRNKPVASLDSPKSKSGSDDENVDEIYKSAIALKKRQKERWGVEMDMVQEVNKNDELCMQAVCALYREIVEGKLAAPLDHKSRITQLATMIINGDSQRRPKKKASELSSSDIVACRQFAKGYSSRLFKIYRTKIDPFFPPSKS